jgi:predicted HAD superfamily hydrolase
MNGSEKACKLVSFDIFDTTLIRKCGVPQNIFYILAKKVFPNNSSYQLDFYNWRTTIGQVIFSRTQNCNYNLNDIYSYLPDYLCDVCPAIDIMNAEKEVEADNLVANKAIKDIIKQQRDSGNVICFISDMYLDGRFLKDILIRESCACSIDMVFVSCELGRRKDDRGMLFQYVRTFFPNIISWVHYGDNYHSDILSASSMGITTKYVNTSFSKSENRILSNYIGYSFYNELSILVGYQRCVRLQLGNTSDISNAADLISSLYIPFIVFLSQEVQRRSLKKVYFLSRDANILCELAKMYFSPQYDVEIRYLYVSRKALIQSCFETLSGDEVKALLGKKSLVGERVSSLLNSLQIPLDAIDGISFKRISDIDQEEYFLKCINDNRDKITSGLKQKRESVLAYLRQEGFLDFGPNIGIVDIGWRGTTRLMLNRLKRKYGKQGDVSFFYFGFEKDMLPLIHGKYSVYLNTPIDQLTIPYFIEIIENYYSAAPHTSTIGYIQRNEEIIPILDDNSNEVLLQLANTNVKVAKLIMSYIINCDSVSFNDAYNVWGMSYLKLWGKSPKLFNLDTFKQVYYYDKKFIIKVPLHRLLRYLIVGATGLPCIDELSLYYTYGIRFRRRYTLHSIIVIFRKIKRRFNSRCL